MKLLIAFGLVAAALASWESSPIYQGSERSFVKGNTYIFSYDGQTVSGVAAKGSSSHSIQQASGKVHVTVGDKYWTMRGDDIKFTYGQRKMEEPRTLEKLASLEQQQLTDEQIAILRLPVRFRYHQGIITDVHFTERDNAWSENLKRSILSMLQMQLSPKTSQAQEFSTVGEKEIDENNKYFTQPERVLEGECEVAYTIVDGEKKDEKEVTKSLNFNKCSKRVDIRYGFRFNSECETCLEEDARPESQVVVNYKVKGDEKSFLIKEINLKSEYLFTPFSTQQQMLATYQHVIMRLIKIVETERSEEPQWSSKKSTIMYNYEKELAREQFWMNGDEESWKSAGFEFLPKKEIVEKAVQQMIESIDESNKDGVKLDSTHQMARIVIVLRMCNREEMMEIHRFVCENNKYTKEQQKKINEIMADALAIAGTKVTVEHLIEKIEKKQISPLKAALTLKSLVNVRVSSEKIVDMVLRLSKSKVAREEPALRQSAMLTAGALMNVMCGKNQERWAVEIDGSKKCTREQKMSWLSTFKTLYTESSDKYERVLVLKSLANSGMDVCVHFLEDIIYSKSEETIIRSTAVDALRMIREEMPRKVQSLLLPIFKSRHQPLSLRMSAVYQIVQSKPTLPVLEQIVDTLNRESSHQLRSFSYSLLRSFEESANPCEKQLSNDVTVVLRSLRFRPSLESRHFHASTFSQSLDLGLTVDFASVLTNESILPRELLSSFDSLFSGQWSKHLAQVGFSQQNLDSILIPLLNKLEKIETESVVRGLRSEKKQAISESLKGLVNQMKIAVRRSESREESFGMLYIRYKNLDYAVLPIDESIISKYTRSTGASSLSELLRDFAKGQRFNVAVASFIYERNRVFPTSIGIPLLTTQRMPTLAVVEGQVKMEISSLRPTLRLQMEPSIASTHVTEMQLLTPLQQTGARVFHSVQATLPIDSTIEYDWERQQLKTIVRPPTSEKRVMIFETRPVNFVRSFSHRGFPMVQEKTISLARLERNAVHYEHEFGEKLTGIKAEVFGSVHRHMFNSQDKLEAILYGENHVQLNLIPTEKAIKEIVFEIEPKWTSEKNGLESPRYNKEFEEDDFRMEDSEEQNEWEPEQKRSSRHTETKRYYEKKIGGENKKGVEGRVVIKGYTVGGPKELKARFEVMGECEQDGKYCRVEVQGKRSPLLADETREWELDCKAELVFPESPKSIRELREQKHREMQATISFRWGAHEKNEIEMKIQVEQDREMQKLVRDIKWENEEDKKKGTISQLETLKEASRLNKLSVLVNHDLTKKNEKIFEQLYSLIKARYFIESEVESIRRTKGSLLVKMVVDPQECRRVNLTLETSEEKLSIPSLLSPMRLPLPSIAKTSSVKFYNKVNDIIAKQATCEVRSNKITTFDDLTYKTPMTTCYQVLAKDCSQEPEYAVLMKHIKKNSEEKTIKIVTAESKEIEIEFDEEKEKLVCKIDGRRVENEETLSENGIELIGERTLEVVLSKITVRFDGYMCQIKADKRTQNKQCGMCGHFDGHRDNEFRRADNEETEDLEDFHRSWLKKDSECEIEEYKLKEKTNYGFEENEKSTEFDSEEDDFERVKKVKKMHKKVDYKDQEEETYEPIEKTIVIERSSKTCFSLEPQPACRHSDEAEETTQNKVKFACVPRGERKTRQMINMIKNEQYDEVSRLVNKLEERFTESIRVPTLCRVF